MKNKKKLLAMSISAVLTSSVVSVAMASNLVAVVFNKPTTKYSIGLQLSQPDLGNTDPIVPPSPNIVKMYNTEILRFALDADGNLWEGSNLVEGINSEVWRMTSHTNVTDLSVSHTHALMIKNGDVYAYGKNLNGQLGTGTTTSSNSWVASGLSGAQSVAAVGNHVKGMSFATIGGTLYSVGDNSEKNLGRISSDSCSAGDCSLSWSSTSMNNITKILSGAERVLIQNSSGEIYTTDDNNSWIKDAEVGLTGLTFGGFHSYGLKGGVVYSYGKNGAGQLGLGNNSPTNQFTATSLSDIKEVRAFVAEMGDGETSSGGYAISNSGELYVVGYNNRVELGIFPPTNIDTWQTNGIKDVVSLMNSGREIYLKKSDGHYYYLDDADTESEPENNIERVQFIVDSDNDGISDQSEIDLGSDPENSGDTPTMILQANNVVTITEDTLFLDDGGLNNYDGSSSSMLSVISGISGKTVKVSFREFNLSDSGDDYLEIYEGTGTEGYYFEECILNECANKSFTSFSDDGSLTFNFETDSDGRWSGWEAMLTLVDKSTLEMTDTDGDGTKDVRDDDDDGDGVSDEQELLDGTDPLNPLDFIAQPIALSDLKTMIANGDDVTGINTSEITNFSHLFNGNSSFSQDISKWDVSSGTNFYAMFYNASSFNYDISGWDVSNATNFGWFTGPSSILTAENIPYAFGGTGVDSDGDSFPDIVEVHEGTDPDDAGSVPNFIVHPSVNETILITEPVTYYDEGGPLRTHNGINPATLILTAPAGYAIKAEVDSFKLWGNDYLKMASGNNPHDDTISGLTCQYSCIGQEITSFALDGSLSFAVGTGFNLEEGWGISITLVDQSTLDLADFDNDGIPNGVDPDDDNDGIADEQELIDGTNPKDENSFILPKLTRSELETMIANGDDLTNIDTSGITDFSNLFSWNSSFNQDISGWNVSNGTNFYNMFYRASNFNQDLGEWKMGNATNIQAMFRDASEFNQNLNGWNVSKVTNFMNVFYKATAFNGEIKDWDVSSGKEFYGMFRNASAFNKNISEWNMSNATDIGQMFSNATIFNQDIAKWDVSKVTNFYGTFSYTSGMNYDLGVLGTNGGWDVSSGENFGQMFYSNDIYNKDISNWDVSKGTDFYQMFMRTTLFNKDLKGWVIKDGAGFDKFYYESSLQVENVPEEFQ